MTQYMRLQRAETQAETDDGPLVFTASTPGTKRDGYDTAALPWRTENYRSNPVITWVHDFAGNRLPIGRADIEVTGGARAGGKSEPEGILAAITFDRADPFAAEVERKYRDGFLHAVSVSWDDVDADGVPTRVSGKDAVAHDLLEIAAVPVPGDPAALLERQAVALRSLARDLTETWYDGQARRQAEIETRIVDTTVGRALLNLAMPEEMRFYDPGEPVAEPEDVDTEPADVAEFVAEDDNDADAADEGLERDAAAEMVAVFAQGTDDSDEDRRRTYRALLPAYRRLGWTAPEFVERAELDALDGETWRGLFLHDEPDMLRVGKVLSRKNQADLTEAMRLIRGVLAAAGDGSEDDAGDGDAGRAIAQTEPPMAQDDDAAEFARILTALLENPTNG